MLEILLEIKNVMDNVTVFGLGFVGAYFVLTGLAELKPKKPGRKKITVTSRDKNNAA